MGLWNENRREEKITNTTTALCSDEEFLILNQIKHNPDKNNQMDKNTIEQVNGRTEQMVCIKV